MLGWPGGRIPEPLILIGEARSRTSAVPEEQRRGRFERDSIGVYPELEVR